MFHIYCQKCDQSNMKGPVKCGNPSKKGGNMLTAFSLLTLLTFLGLFKNSLKMSLSIELAVKRICNSPFNAGPKQTCVLQAERGLCSQVT